MTDIEAMAKRATSEINTSDGNQSTSQEIEAIIARHYREVVRELVLAARVIERLLDREEYELAAGSPLLHKALEAFRDVS